MEAKSFYIMQEKFLQIERLNYAMSNGYCYSRDKMGSEGVSTLSPYKDLFFLQIQKRLLQN